MGFGIKIGIWIKLEPNGVNPEFDKFLTDLDGDILTFDSVIEAKNYLFTQQYSYEYVQMFLEFRPVTGADDINYDW